MRFYLDTEFIEYPCTIDLISVGIVSEDGHEFYAESREFDESKASQWVKDNVIAKLWCLQRNRFADYASTGGYGGYWRRDQIREGIKMFINECSVTNTKPEFWGYYCVAPKTKILTASLEWREASTIEVGDVLMGFDEEALPGNGRSRRWRRWQSAIAIGTQHVERPTYELRFDDGTAIRCAEDHLWLVSSDDGTHWVRTDRLQVDNGNGVGSNVVKPLNVWQREESHDAGYLAAALDGEGHLSTHQMRDNLGYSFRLGFAQKENPMFAEVRRLLMKREISFTEKMRPDGVWRVNVTKRDDLLRLLGTIRPLRLLPKFVPDLVGAMPVGRTVKLVSAQETGVQTLIALNTSTRTYIAEGLASHNCDYDWVAFCWLFGAMIDLPKGWPFYCRDIKQLADSMGIRREWLPEQKEDEHVALADARWNRRAHNVLRSLSR